MEEKKYYNRYDISPSDFAYKHFRDRTLDNFYLIKDNRRQLHRTRNMSFAAYYATPDSYEKPLLVELCALYDTAYMNQRRKRMANLYQIEVRVIAHSKICGNSERLSSFQKHIVYDVWDGKDIWEDLIVAQRMAFFR